MRTYLVAYYTFNSFSFLKITLFFLPLDQILTRPSVLDTSSSSSHTHCRASVSHGLHLTSNHCLWRHQHCRICCLEKWTCYPCLNNFTAFFPLFSSSIFLSSSRSSSPPVEPAPPVTASRLRRLHNRRWSSLPQRRSNYRHRLGPRPHWVLSASPPKPPPRLGCRGPGRHTVSPTVTVLHYATPAAPRRRAAKPSTSLSRAPPSLLPPSPPSLLRAPRRQALADLRPTPTAPTSSTSSSPSTRRPTRPTYCPTATPCSVWPRHTLHGAHIGGGRYNTTKLPRPLPLPPPRRRCRQPIDPRGHL